MTDTLISWLHLIAVSADLPHVTAAISTQSYGNSGLDRHVIGRIVRRVRVTGKGGKERIVPVDAAFFAELAAYLREERPASCRTAECFVVLRGPTAGQPLTEAGLRRIFRTHRLASGALRVRPHRLRHTYGTELASAGIDLLALRELMGHANPETTAAYVHLSPETLAAEYARARAAAR